MNEKVELKLIELEKFESIILDLGAKMHPGKTFPLDILANAVLNRSLQLSFGFIDLIRNGKYIAACHLVRCHLDNLLRFSGAWLVENPHQYALNIMEGKRVEEIKDRDGKRMKDWYLRNKLNEEFPWVSSVYHETSGFIHLSRKHIFTTSRLKSEENRTVDFVISKKDSFVQDESRIEAIQGMIEISKTINHFVEGWIATKRK